MQVLESVGFRVKHERQSMNLLQKLRIERGYSLRKLAELSGVNKATILKIESGMVRPQLLSLGSLANALGVEVEVLLPLRIVDEDEEPEIKAS